MRKHTASRTVTTVNFVTLPGETTAASCTWSSRDDVRIVDEYASMHLENNLDAHGYRVEVEVFEYNLPGLRVVALVENGTVLTAFVVEDDTAARLHTAVRRQRPVTITYVNAEGDELVRTIEPHSLRTTKAGDVIVKALDRKSAEHRSFRLDRVLAYTVHRTAFIIDEAYVAELMEAQHAVPLPDYTGSDTPAVELFTWTESVNGKAYTTTGTAPAYS